jgi:hypothetical protein
VRFHRDLVVENAGINAFKAVTTRQTHARCVETFTIPTARYVDKWSPYDAQSFEQKGRCAPAESGIRAKMESRWCRHLPGRPAPATRDQADLEVRQFSWSKGVRGESPVKRGFA